jgi:hypothetical protein
MPDGVMIGSTGSGACARAEGNAQNRQDEKARDYSRPELKPRDNEDRAGEAEALRGREFLLKAPQWSFRRGAFCFWCKRRFLKKVR